MVQYIEALSAERVAAVNQDARYFLTHIKLITAIVTKVKTTRLIICLNNLAIPIAPIGLLQFVPLILISFPFLSKCQMLFLWNTIKETVRGK